MRVVDRLILWLTRRSRRREVCLHGKAAGSALPGLEGYYPADSLPEAHTAAHSGISRRSRGPLVKAVATAVVALALPAAAFAGGVEYAEYRADEQVMETDAYYQTQLREAAQDSEARDVCLATAEARGGGGYWAGAWARLEEAPELTVCYAEQAADAAEIQADSRSR